MAQALATHDRYLADFRPFAEALPAGEPAWLRRLRRRALDRFAQVGFPTARRGNERWKYTSVLPIAEATFHLSPPDAPQPTKTELRRAAPWDDSWARIVFVNGRYSPALSTPPHALEGVRLMNLEDAALADGGLVERHLARHVPLEQDDGFAALNTAYLWDGAFVHIGDGAAAPQPIHILYLTTDAGQPTVSYPRTLIVAGRESRASVIETYLGLSPAPCFTDAVTEIALDQGAQVDHYRLLLEAEAAFHVGTTQVHQGQDSTFSSVAFARGLALGRSNLYVLLDGPGAACHLNGLYVTWDRHHLDHYLNVDHAKPHCTSRLYYKGILDDSSRAVFGGIVLVRPGAVKTDAEQADKNLILSDEAEVDSKPSLEIYADDVKCGHGATAGTIAEDAVFYMRSRGLDQRTAAALLVKGFAGEVIETVQVRPLRTYLDRLISGILPRLHLERLG